VVVETDTASFDFTQAGFRLRSAGASLRSGWQIFKAHDYRI
jgi:hypothetical protein